MNAVTSISKRARILGGLWGALVGDALGVPVEFWDRHTLRADPVRDMRGFGTHNQPAGTWSDDGSLILCTVDSLVQHEFDLADTGSRFVRWYREGLWTPHRGVFDIGAATSRALARIAGGVEAELAGGEDQFSNGNGSLMRILPVSLRFADQTTRDVLDRVHRASAMTHRHPRSQMACGFLTLVLRELLKGEAVSDGFTHGLSAFRDFYEHDPRWAAEFDHFQTLLAGNLVHRTEDEIESGGYVIHTLTASLWCLLTSSSFGDCVLKAVNLGGDADTTGCVAGGLAGVHYGLHTIPKRWIRTLARHDDVETLFNQFTEIAAPTT